MKKAAVQKARARLDKARAALAIVEASTRFSDFEPAWCDFLAALKGVHSIFEASAGKQGPAAAWYGRKINERRKDPLVSYVHAARNADEYGIEAIAQHEPGGTWIGRAGETTWIDGIRFDRRGNATVTVLPTDGKLPAVGVTLPHVRLVTVHDRRFNDSFDPPKEHLGKPLKDGSPVEVARLALAYHERLTDEAEQYVT